MRKTILFIAAALAGIGIFYLDSSPGWDDTALLVFLFLLGGGIIGFLADKRPWLYALVFGSWIPFVGLVYQHDWMMLIILLFPFTGVYTGWGLRLLTHHLFHRS